MAKKMIFGILYHTKHKVTQLQNMIFKLFQKRMFFCTFAKSIYIAAIFPNLIPLFFSKKNHLGFEVRNKLKTYFLDASIFNAYL